MHSTIHTPSSGSRSRSRYVEAFASSGSYGVKTLVRFLPPRTDPDYMLVLIELIRTDIDHHQAAGVRRRIEDYQIDFPELFVDEQFRSLFEERKRVAHQEMEKLGRFLDSVTRVRPDSDVLNTPAPFQRLAPEDFLTQSRVIDSESGEEAQLTNAVSQIEPPSQVPENVPTAFIVDKEEKKPASDSAKLKNRFPLVGDEFLGFKLIDQLGTGAFAKVFLGEQLALANRPVALKVTTRPTKEPQRLAKLRHTNIMPIYSVHDRFPLQAVCMPFLGRQTLSDLLKEFRKNGNFSLASTPVSTEVAVGRSTLHDSASTGSVEKPAKIEERVCESPIRLMLEKMSHVERVVWLMTNIAEGLRHAHEQGILHLDLKPANVLLADDGQPLLLDFNLSYDVKTNDRERTGGTLPYMSPEQLDEYREKPSDAVDHRSDLFALGVIFHELLTGKNPFVPKQDQQQSLSALAQARKTPVPDVRTLNPAIPPAIASIVQKLLNPKIVHRYQSISELLTDLELDRRNEPLRFARNTCWRENVRKWKRRHPRALVKLGAMLLVVGLIAMSGQARESTRKANHYEALESAKLFRRELPNTRLALLFSNYYRTRPEAESSLLGLLDRHGYSDNGGSIEPPQLPYLEGSDRTELMEDIAEGASLMAFSRMIDDRRLPEKQRTGRASGEYWCQVAENCYRELGRSPRHIGIIRDYFSKPDPIPSVSFLVNDAEGSHKRDRILELFFRSSALRAEDRVSMMVDPLAKILDYDPTNYDARFLLGWAYGYKREYSLAREHYRIAKSLRTDQHYAHLLYAETRMLQHRYEEAEEELAFLDQLKKEEFVIAEGHFVRAKVRLELARTNPGFLPKAKENIDFLTQTDPQSIRALGMKALWLKRSGKNEEAMVVYHQLIATEIPDGFKGYTRAWVREQFGDFAGAEKDLLACLNWMPNHEWCLTEITRIQTLHLDKRDEAKRNLAHLVDVNPSSAAAMAYEGLILAREGNEEQASRKLIHSLILSEEPYVRFACACGYALLANRNSDHASRALDQLTLCHRYHILNREMLELPIFVSIRERPEFQQLLNLTP